MMHWLEKLLTRIWNRRASRQSRAPECDDLTFGRRVADGEPTPARVTIAQEMRAQHVVLVGKSGSGKSSQIKSIGEQDIRAGRGFENFDLHRDTTPFFLASIAEYEKTAGQDLSNKTIVIAPADPERSVGVNLLESTDEASSFVQIAEFTSILRHRWNLDGFGPRTQELLNNSLHALADSHSTLVDLGVFLTTDTFRARCVQQIRNAEIKQYFETRYEPLSQPMKRVLSEPVLNKITTFTADTRFRHLLGQTHSTFSLIDAMDCGYWVLLDLPKGLLGETAITFASLFLSMTSRAIFARRRTQKLFSLFLDEFPSLVSWGSSVETMLSESRKFGCSILTGQQFMGQSSPEVRTALMSTGTQLFFQLSSDDAHVIATALDGGKSLAERLKNLRRRHFVAKIGSERWQTGITNNVKTPRAESEDLYDRCQMRWARSRAEIETEIRERQSVSSSRPIEALNDWE